MTLSPAHLCRSWRDAHDSAVLELTPRSWPAISRLPQRLPALAGLRLWNCKLLGDQLDLHGLAPLPHLAALRVWRVTRAQEGARPAQSSPAGAALFFLFRRSAGR